MTPIKPDHSIAPGGPDSVQDKPPVRLDGDEPVVNPKPDEPDVQRPRPNDPSASKTSILMDVPNKPGSKTDLNFDKKYHREQLPATDTDIGQESMPWLKEALQKEPVIGDWTITKTQNNAATIEKYNGPDYEQRLREQLASDGLAKKEIDELVKRLQKEVNGKLWKKDFVVTIQNPKEGAVAVKEMFNNEYDLVGRAKNQEAGFRDDQGTLYSKSYTRPGVADGEAIFLTNMVMDNWRVACGGVAEKVRTLNKIGFDNAVTPGFDKKMENLEFSHSRDDENPGSETILFFEGDPEFDDILKNTPHGQKSEQLFSQNAAELGSKRITKFEVTETHEALLTDNGARRYDLMFYAE